MGKPRICVLPPLSLLTTKELKIFQYRWKFLRLAGFESHPLRHTYSSLHITAFLTPCYLRATVFHHLFGMVSQHGQRLRKVQRPPGMGVSKGWQRPPAEGREVPYSLHRRTRQAVLESTLRYSAASPGKRGWRGPGYPSRCPRTHRR